MKGTFHLIASLCLASLLLGGCGKKKDEEPVAESPASNSAEATSKVEQPPSVAAQRASDLAALSTTPAPSGGIAELATTDVAYETWFKKRGLDLNDPKMLDSDPDGDGFTNREEFLADTDPKDPNSRPGVHSTMRLKEFTEVKVPFMLRSVEGDTAKIEHEDGTNPKTESLKSGQTLHGTSYKVQRVEHVLTQDKDGNPIDASKVTIEDTNTQQKIDLVKDMSARSSASFAVLTSTDGKTSLTVRQGDTFSWPNDPSATYRVVDLRNDQVIVEQIENKKMWTIPKK